MLFKTMLRSDSYKILKKIYEKNKAAAIHKIPNKCLGINLIMGIKDFCNLSYRSVKKEVKRNSRRWKYVLLCGSTEPYKGVMVAKVRDKYQDCDGILHINRKGIFKFIGKHNDSE